MSYFKIYGFKKFFILGIVFLILCLGVIGWLISILVINGLSWYLAALIVLVLYFVYSVLYLRKMLYLNFRDEVKSEGSFVEMPILYERETNHPYIRIDDKHIPLLGLYPRQLWKKFPEQSKITAFLPNEKKTAILIK